MATAVLALHLQEEVRTSIRLVERGLAELQSIDEVNDQYFPAALLLSTGLERLMKCILCYRSKVVSGRYPSPSEIKAFGHDLERLRDRVATACFDESYRQGRQVADADASFLASDMHVRALLTALTRFAKSGRYFNLDVVLGQPPAMEAPEREWQRIETTLALERPDLQKLIGEPGAGRELHAILIGELVGRIERFTRALCRLFTLGPLGPEARVCTPYVTPFLFLRDTDLATRDYRAPRADG
jgi:hypothetical protein